MTSRVRCTQPPVRVVWHSGQDSGAWTTRLGGFHPRPGEAVLTLLSRLLLLLPPAFLRLAAGLCPGILAPSPPPDSRASRPSTRFPHLGNGVLLLPGDDPLLFRDNRQQSLPRTGYGGFPARQVQVLFPLFFYATTALQPLVFSSGQRPSANSPH